MCQTWFLDIFIFQVHELVKFFLILKSPDNFHNQPFLKEGSTLQNFSILC